MKTTIDKEFFEKWKNEKVVMWCKKEEYAEEFCRLMNEQGLKWITGKNYLKNTEWDCYMRWTAYNFNIGTFSDVEYFKEEGYIILDFEDYIVHEKETAGMKSSEKLLSENEKLFKDVENLNNALAKAVVEELLKDKTIEELQNTSNVQKHLELCNEIHSTYKSKNEKYGDSFNDTIKRYGIIAALTRMSDKFSRIENNIINNVDDNEKLEDNLLDLANYCLMTVMSLDKDNYYNVDGQGD